MEFKSSYWVALTVIVTAVGVSQVSANGKNTPIPVTVTIADSAFDHPLRVQSDGHGPYINTREITSIIGLYQTGTDWILTTYTYPKLTPSHRTVHFDLAEPTSPDNPPPPIGAGFVQSHLIAKCHLVSVDMRRISVGSTTACPGSFRFQAFDGRWYRLSFQPANYPHVDNLNVSCVAADATGCRRWTVTPGGTTLTGTDPNPKNVGRLLRIDPRDDSVVEELGDYYLSFLIIVAR